jgi:signal transduction histidine kinase
VVCLLARRQRELVEQLHAAQAGLADRARLEERTRIAREMHDVVGHALTVSLLHVASARLALDEDPEEAKASLAEAERLGRSSLAEVRQAVGMLREEGSGSIAPLPAGDQLGDLLESFRRAGLPVTYEVVGDPSTLTATGGLTLYRILQEALTNVVRHAPGATARVRVEVRSDGTSLSVDNPVDHQVRDPEGGTGVLGMRERAEAVGGRLTAGPTTHGWRVEAELPVTLVPVSAERV